MERAVALKKLRKILGDKLGYRVDPRAPDQDDRDEAKPKLKEAQAREAQLEREMNQRKRELLEADGEYQNLKKAYEITSQYRKDLLSITMSYRFTVGISGEMFFHVKAQGDSWEEIISKLQKERA